MLHLLKKFVPRPFVSAYHLALSWCAAAWYGHPSEKMIVIGVTGTNGKTTTSYLIAKVLEASGYKTGCTTTALFKIGDDEWLNDTKMTMLGRFALQKLLRRMVDAGCRYAVVETSSQGIVQHRHRGINYDVAVFTNLTPEHIEAHGGFENYKQAKIELFRHLMRGLYKKFDGKRVHKTEVLNRMSPYAKDFLPSRGHNIGVAWYGIGTGDAPGKGEALNAMDVREDGWSMRFTVENIPCVIHLPGVVNVENAMAALTVARRLGIDLKAASDKLAGVGGLPGRFERIVEGQPYEVIVDYAPEPASLAALYKAAEKLPHQRLIHVLGSCGGGRDVARRPVLGRMAAEHADKIIVTNEDPYDDDPRQIMDEVAEGARKAGAGDKVTIVEDRKEAVFAAMREAKPGDLVLLTGKGCEQAIMGRAGSRVDWDEREVARQAIKATMGYTSDKT